MKVKQAWRLFVAVMNVFFIAQILGFVGIFSNRELTDKLVSLTADEITNVRSAFRELMDTGICEN